MFDVFSIISKGFAGLTSGGSTATSAATISQATGELTKAGLAMGGQSAVDANMQAGAGSESALGNFFHGLTGSNVTGADSKSWFDQAKAIYDKNQSQRQPEQMGSPTTPGTSPHFQQLGNLGATEATKAPAWSLQGAIGNQQKQITSADFKNQAGV